jgi:hypothetical protein
MSQSGNRFLLGLIAVSTFMLWSNAALGYGTNLTGSKTSQQAADDCAAAGKGTFECTVEVLFWDPPVSSVTGLTLTVQYDPSRVAFAPELSGPLGQLSVGGDAPPPNPGVGTQPLALFPTSGVAAGAPLPGSTFTFSDAGGLLTVNYQLAAPVTTDSDINFLRLAFRLNDPVLVDFAQSTVTYSENSPGQYTQVSFSCTTSDGLNQCGSSHPSTGVTFNYVSSVPEPATFALLVAGFVALGAGARRRT